MRPHQEDEPEEYRGEQAGAPGQAQGGQPPPRQSRYQSSPPRGQSSQSPPRPPQNQSPGTQSPPTYVEQTWQAGSEPSQRGPPRQQPPAAGQPEPPSAPGEVGQPTPPGPGGRSGGRGPGGQPTPRPPAGGSAFAPIGVEELIETEVVTVGRDAPVATVVAEMAERNVGSVVVVEDDSPVGIVTDRRIALALETTPDVSERQVDEVIDGDFVTGSTDMSVLDVLRRLSEEGIRRLPIVDEDGALVGIVTVDDVLVLFSEELQHVADVIRTQSGR